jgi:hypothetical protein
MVAIATTKQCGRRLLVYSQNSYPCDQYKPTSLTCSLHGISFPQQLAGRLVTALSIAAEYNSKVHGVGVRFYVQS